LPSSTSLKMFVSKCSPSLAIKEMQIKITLRFHLTFVRIAIMSNTTTNRCYEDVGKKEPSYTVGGNASWCDHSGKNLEAT
jgi:hypothetical protein